MAEQKTKPTRNSVAKFIAALDDPRRRADSKALVALMRKVTGERPVMWGTGIVGFGRYEYTYASGHSGESCATGFAPRKTDFSIYLLGGTPTQQALLKRLGKHRMGKACLSIKRLEDVDMSVLEKLVADAYAEIFRRYPPSTSSK